MHKVNTILLSKKHVQELKSICIQKSINTNISHQLFNYKITFVNCERTNSKGDFVLQNLF